MKLTTIFNRKTLLSTLASFFFTTQLAVADNFDVLGHFLEQNNSASTTDSLSDFLQNNLALQNSEPLLNSRSALILNNHTGEILYQKNKDNVMPIASISKVISAMVTLDAKLDMNEMITITDAEIDRLKGTGSRLAIGTTLSRAQLLHLSLMSSENRATHALGRTYPGGMEAFVKAMNQKAQDLGMHQSRFFEPTGLDPRNVSTASDLAKMVAATSKYPQILKDSTSNFARVNTVAGVTQQYQNSNALVREGGWDIEMQKTGYIREAGRSMVVKAKINKQPHTIILLNAPSSTMRVNDARTLKTWVLQRPI